MKTINLLKPHNTHVTAGERIYLQHVMMKAYDHGLLAGEARAYLKVIDLLRAQEIKFLSVLDRRTAARGDHTEMVRRMMGSALDATERVPEGGITEKK